MANINKIRIGDNTLHIVPEIGTGLELGTGSNNGHIIYVNLGDAIVSGSKPVSETGMSITTRGFVIEIDKFSNFLKSLGFKTE